MNAIKPSPAEMLAGFEALEASMMAELCQDNLRQALELIDLEDFQAARLLIAEGLRQCRLLSRQQERASEPAVIEVQSELIPQHEKITDKEG